MPKENRIDNYSTDDMNEHLSAVEKSIKKLRKRLKYYFKKDEMLRTRFAAIEKQVLDFSSDCRTEVERIVKGQSAKKKKTKQQSSDHHAG
jgi:predicted  nucleic acid-binding Zn-ribbon protein